VGILVLLLGWMLKVFDGVDDAADDDDEVDDELMMDFIFRHELPGDEIYLYLIHLQL
jgi:hypothetical protein